MTVEQFAEVTRFVQKYHGFAKANYWKEGKVDSVVINTCGSFAEAEKSVQKSLKWYGKIISIEKMIKK